MLFAWSRYYMQLLSWITCKAIFPEGQWYKMLGAGHNFRNRESQPDVWLFIGTLQYLWNFDELLVSVCGFFHVSSNSVAPGLKMGQLIFFWTFLMCWLCFLGWSSSCPQQHFRDNNGWLLIFRGAVGHRWVFQCFLFSLTLNLLQVPSECKTGDKIWSCHSRRAGCRVQLCRSQKPVLFINFNQFLVQCITHSCGSCLQSQYLSSSPFEW